MYSVVQPQFGYFQFAGDRRVLATAVFQGIARAKGASVAQIAKIESTSWEQRRALTTVGQRGAAQRCRLRRNEATICAPFPVME